MQFTPITAIQLIDRQRREIKTKHIEELKSSIRSKGLLHPIVLSSRFTENGEPVLALLAGECRLRSMRELHEEGLEFCCNGKAVPRHQVPFTLVGDLSADAIMEAELEENVFRLPLTWQEESEARAKIHFARKAKNPEQTYSDTAKEIAAKTENSVSTERDTIQRSVALYEARDNPRLAKARTAKEAYAILLKEVEAKAKAALAIAVAGETPDCLVKHGDAFTLIRSVGSGTISSIICDPPYGIRADEQGKDAKHYYEDAPDYALEFCRMVLEQGFRITKPRAVLFMFCDIEHFITLRSAAQRMGWSTWRTPILWRKGDTGSAPWGRAGFIRTYECILFAVKGQQELVSTGGPDVMDFSRVQHSERVHAAEKPVALLRHLISISMLPGETVFDPCCGSGNIITAARQMHASIVAFERDETYFSEAVQKVTAPLEEVPKPANQIDLEDL